MTVNFRTAITLTASLILLAACGKKDEPPIVVGIPSSAVDQGRADSARISAEKRAADAAAAVKNNSDPKGSPSVPLEHYKELTEDSQILAQYLRLAGVPEDVTPLASIFSPRIVDEQDGFKRRDSLAKYRETLLQLAKDTKDGAYFWVDMTTELITIRPAVEAYDFEKKSFPIRQFAEAPSAPKGRDGWAVPRFPEHPDGKGVRFSSGATVRFYNWLDFQALPVSDEALARRIEDERGKYLRGKTPPGGAYGSGNKPLLTLRVYGYAAAASADAGSVRAQIMAVALVDPDGKIVAKR